MPEDRQYDVCIVGAGLVGLSVARALADRHSGVSMVIIDKEDRVGAHQSSHNSGVVHSGLYYRPGSLKATLCAEGRESIYGLCDEAGIAVRRSGKLVIATRSSEIAALDELERRGRANGLAGLERIGPRGIAEIEPEVTGLEALHVPDAGVVDFSEVATHMAAQLGSGGAELLLNRTVTAIEQSETGVTVIAAGERLSAKVLVNCGGLQSDKIAAVAGIAPSVRIVPFRGEYYRLAGSKAGLVRALVYPVPDPRYPFLGVHFTRRIDGTIEVGPNAVLALGREQYRGVRPNWRELRETLATPGFPTLAARNWRAGLRELVNSRSRRLYARLARRLVPAVRAADLLPGGAGVRAQAVAPDGSLVDDFVIEEAARSIHVLNAPSPGATASPAIGRYVAERVSLMMSG